MIMDPHTTFHFIKNVEFESAKGSCQAMISKQDTPMKFLGVSYLLKSFDVHWPEPLLTQI